MIYLASQSPRRQALLEQLGIPYRTLSVDIKEERHPGEPPEDFVRRMAMEKAEQGWNRLEAWARMPVLGADTVVVLDNRVLGKPRNEKEAREHLEQLSGRSHQVFSAVAVVAGWRAVRLNTSRVWFRQLSPEECVRYCATGEPLGKAGSYAIQGIAAAFITRLEGSYSGVMGLPLFETAQLLAEVGIHVLETT